MNRWLFIGAAVIGGTALPQSASAASDVPTAIKNGVAYLRSLQKEDGTWPHEDIGATALAALTLLECGAAAEDPAVVKAAQAVRRRSIRLTHTYSLSLVLLFLDRLDDPRDLPIIRSLGARLLHGQNAAGGWTYSCPRLEKPEMRRLTALLDLPANRGAVADPARGLLPEEPVTKDIQMKNERIRKGEPPSVHEISGDNSNTQFATLALWVARRNGVAVKKAVAQVGKRFQTTQAPTGGWGYVGPQPTATMTCAGLLGLAIAQGSANEAAYRADFSRLHKDPRLAKPKAMPDPLKDSAISAGLAALASVLDTGTQTSIQRPPEDDFYFWWSVERVAVAFDLTTIGKVDWYAQGTANLLRQQKPDGRWVGIYKDFGGADTCFALLFLQRANLAQDLTFSLRGKMSDRAKVIFQARGAFLPDNPHPGKKPVDVPGNVAKTKPAGPPDIELKIPDLKPAKATPAQPGADSALDEREIKRMTEDFLDTPPEKQEALLEVYKKARGPLYTQALAGAIPQLQGAVKGRARDALAERMARMTAATLRERLRDNDREMRRAAALACAMKEDKSHIPDLIALIDDAESPVVVAARAALKALAGQDFGPHAADDREERAEARTRWKQWWEKQSGQ
jgi:hypothetical protein